MTPSTLFLIGWMEVCLIRIKDTKKLIDGDVSVGGSCKYIEHIQSFTSFYHSRIVKRGAAALLSN